MNIYLIIGSTVFLGVASTLLFFRYRHGLDIKALETVIQGRSSPVPRTDLPDAVSALATRLGAHTDAPSAYVSINQKGVMIMKEGSKSEMAFKAKQYMSTTACRFSWHARSYWGLMDVLDYYDGTQGGLQVWLLGVISIVKEVGTASVGQGELLRYLAEIPYNPDAILFNHDLDWTVVDAHTLKVATGEGAFKAEVTFTLDDTGSIVSMYTPSRPYKKGDITNYYPWKGRFYAYKTLDGRLIPTLAEVGWVLSTSYFIYWKGDVVGWERGRIDQ